MDVPNLLCNIDVFPNGQSAVCSASDYPRIRRVCDGAEASTKFAGEELVDRGICREVGHCQLVDVDRVGLDERLDVREDECRISRVVDPALWRDLSKWIMTSSNSAHAQEIVF